jgi:RNA polymerase sigma-70 factor (ECF subfamily)
MKISDEELIHDVLQGDTESFAFIVDRYKVQIFNLMYRYSNTREDAADMTQEVFCRAFEKLRKYRHREQFFSWLYTLALNYARDWARKRKKRGRAIAGYSMEAGIDAEPPIYSGSESAQDVDHLAAALETLADDRREMVLLRYRHERSIKELAEIFRLSESAVKMRLHRALDDLRSVLEKNNHGQ